MKVHHHTAYPSWNHNPPLTLQTDIPAGSALRCRREYADYMNLEDTAERAITECIREGVLAEFLSRYRAEAKAMSLYAYDEEKHM